LSLHRSEIWLDHLEALTHAARAFDGISAAMNEDIPGNYSDLGFYVDKVNIKIDDIDTNWSLQQWDDATWLVIEEGEDDDIESVQEDVA